MGNRGTILMSEKERDSLVVMERVKLGELKMSEAALVLGISYRQCWRRWGRYAAEGAGGLVNRLRGKKGNRATPEDVSRAVVKLWGHETLGSGLR